MCDIAKGRLLWLLKPFTAGRLKPYRGCGYACSHGDSKHPTSVVVNNILSQLSYWVTLLISALCTLQLAVSCSCLASLGQLKMHGNSILRSRKMKWQKTARNVFKRWKFAVCFPVACSRGMIADFKKRYGRKEMNICNRALQEYKVAYIN